MVTSVFALAKTFDRLLTALTNGEAVIIPMLNSLPEIDMI